ncbi:hypothetical protein [Caulobacter sp.]|uniref:hypothetical protein n=1 Tax=Caulobacter sp. TaxID=78 RepID=UPI001B237F1C|nr:hypothetical protein [Caulobacter sp.]MBO9546056.1 hypothetical protein [Caulobacter sp.]
MDSEDRARKIAWRGRWTLGLAAAAAPSIAHADMVWPALFLEPRLLSVPVVVLGLLIESAMLRFGFGLSWRRSALLAIVVNAVSAALGFFVIPLAGIAWEFFPGQVLYAIFDLGTFNPFTWTANFLLAVAITTGIEAACLRIGFKLPWSRMRWGLWLGANAVTVALAFLSFAIEPANDQQLYYPWLIG